MPDSVYYKGLEADHNAPEHLSYSGDSNYQCSTNQGYHLHFRSVSKFDATVELVVLSQKSG